ncbi:MAG TPA: response regulator transcription factor [Microlunatus sp.]
MVTIRIVVADDQALVRTGLRMVLNAQPDIDVVGEAADGLEAVEAARRLHPDIVLMDVRMPGMDGVTATKRILDEAPSKPDDLVKMIILTTYHVDSAVYAALRAGASGFLLKDSEPEELIRAIHAVAAGEAWLDPPVARRLLTDFAAQPETNVPPPATLEQLTPRERDVLTLIAHGLSNDDVARHLVLGTTTIKTHVGRIFMKLGLHDRAQAVAVAYQSGLVRPGDRPPSSNRH